MLKDYITFFNITQMSLKYQPSKKMWRNAAGFEQAFDERRCRADHSGHNQQMFRLGVGIHSARSDRRSNSSQRHSTVRR